jgi:hypothetical protein
VIDQRVPTNPYETISSDAWAELRRRYPHPARIGVALALALDRDAAVALLRGEAVAPERLDRVQLRRACVRRLVRLDERAIDLLEARRQLVEGAA